MKNGKYLDKNAKKAIKFNFFGKNEKNLLKTLRKDLANLTRVCYNAIEMHRMHQAEFARLWRGQKSAS